MLNNIITMAIVRRGDLDRPLTISEMDGNFDYLEALASAGPTGSVTLNLNDVTTIGNITTNEIIVGTQSPNEVYSLLGNGSLLSIKYPSTGPRSYFSAFDEWDGEDWFDAYYERNDGNGGYYEIYANYAIGSQMIGGATGPNITLEVGEGLDLEEKRTLLNINRDGFLFRNNSNYVGLNLDLLQDGYILQVPNKIAGTYTIATIDDLNNISGINFSEQYVEQSFGNTITSSLSSDTGKLYTRVVSNTQVANQYVFSELANYVGGSELRASNIFFNFKSQILEGNFKSIGVDTTGVYLSNYFGDEDFNNSFQQTKFRIDISNTTDNRTANIIDASGDIPMVGYVEPPAAVSAGVTGEIRVSASFIYICVENGVWRRAALTSW